MCGYDADCRLDPDFVESLEVGYGRGADDYIAGTYKLKAGPENEYMIDRQSVVEIEKSELEAFALHALALQFARPAHSFGFFAGPLFRRLFIGAPQFHLAENAFALHLLFQRLQRLVNIVVGTFR